MAILISFLNILFLQTSIIYENCVTDNADDCRYTDFQIDGISATLDRCGSQPKNLFMGPYGFKTSVTKTFINFPPNNLIEFKVGIWKLDSWDGEGVQIYANDQLLEHLTLFYFDGEMICRNNIWQDQYRPITLKFQMAGNDLTIKLKDNLQSNNFYEDLWDESWGFRDFILRLAIPCVNFYTECNYMGTQFQICKGEQTKLQNSIPFEIRSILMGPNIIIKMKGPNYFGGMLQEITSSQPCLDGFKFPKVNFQE